MKTLQATEPTAGRHLLARTVAVACLAGLVVLMAVVLGGLAAPGRSTSLAGTWMGQIPDGGRIPVDVPFRMTRLGLPPEGTIRLENTVTIPAIGEPAALLVSGARHHLQVTWDGQVVGTMGDLPGPLSLPRRDRLIVPLPPGSTAAGEHVIELVVRGDHGEGGLWGEVRVGRLGDLERHADGRTTERMALTATLCIASILGLVISAVRPSQREFLWFGLFCAASSAATFAGDDSWWLASSRLDLKLRVHAAFYVLIPGTGLLFAHDVASPHGRNWPAAPFLAGLLVAAFVLLWPDTRALPIVELLADIAAVAAVLVGVAMLRRALLDGNSTASSIMLAVGILVVAAAAERLSHELGAFDLRLLLPAFMLFLGTTTAALVLGRSDLADRYRQLVDSARDAILVVLPDGTIEESNDAANRMLDRNPVGLRLRDVVVEDEGNLVAEHRQVRMGPARRAELHLVGGNGRRTSVESVATDLPEGRMLLVMRDISARRKVEEGMLHAARMETVGIIAGGIAHDFNNTMTALMAHIGLLRLKVTEEKDQERLQRMEAVIRRAAHMTRRLLTLARGGEKDRRPVNPAEPVHSAVELTRSMLPRNVTIKERIEPDLPLVLGSADDLEQAVLNLLVNARDAVSDQGGTIRVRVRPHRSGGLPAGVRIDVEDDGPGIPEGIRTAIWEPFFTTKGEGRGTGLGLSVVARVVREHGGHVELHRVKEEDPQGRLGTRFTIYLPTQVEGEPMVIDASRSEGQRILVVDDEDDIRELIRSELVSRGYRVDTASSAENALSRIEEEGLQPDLLVTDVVMPGRDGISLAHELSTRFPGLRVVVVSGFIPQHADALLDDWQRLGKPFTAEQLATAVRRAILTDPRLDSGGDLPTQEA